VLCVCLCVCVCGGGFGPIKRVQCSQLPFHFILPIICGADVAALLHFSSSSLKHFLATMQALFHPFSATFPPFFHGYPFDIHFACIYAYLSIIIFVYCPQKVAVNGNETTMAIPLATVGSHSLKKKWPKKWLNI